MAGSSLSAKTLPKWAIKVYIMMSSRQRLGRQASHAKHIENFQRFTWRVVAIEHIYHSWAVISSADKCTRLFPPTTSFPDTLIQGRPPEGWERSLGDADERVRRQGRAVMEYAARMNTMGIQEESLGGNVNPIADHVATIGRDKMRLLPVASAAFEPKPPTFEGKNRRSNVT